MAADGWEVTIDGRRVGWRDSDGLVTVAVAPGLHHVVARQVLLPEDVAGLTLSLTGAAGWLALAWRSRRPALTTPG